MISRKPYPGERYIGSPIEGEVLIVFDCPVHGIEIGSFCSLAFDKHHIKRWNRSRVEVVGILDIKEINTHLAKETRVSSRFLFVGDDK